MAKMCDECLDVYTSGDLNEKPYVASDGSSFYPCPKRGSGGEVVEIDDLILPTIRALNALGYYTVESCAGHLEDRFHTTIYIKFDEGVIMEEKMLPKGFKSRVEVDEETMGEYVIIYKNILLVQEVKAFQDILTAGLQLFAWTNTLTPPEYKLSGFAGMIFGEDFLEQLGLGKEKEKEVKIIDMSKLKKEVAKGKGTITMDDLFRAKEEPISEKEEKPEEKENTQETEGEEEKPKTKRRTRKKKEEDEE